MKTDRVAGGVIFVLACLYLLEARSFETGFIADPIGPKAFPYVLGTILLGLGIGLAFRPEAEPAWPPSRVWWRWGVVVLLLAAYAAVLKPLGFIVATTGLLALLSVLFGGRLAKSVLFALGFSIANYLLFRWLLALPLPPGTLFLGRG